MIAGARAGILSGLRRLVALSMARDLNVYLVPGVEIARANGLDIDAAGMRIVASPRHANVLLIVGEIPAELRESAAVIYAQMMRPRILFSLGAAESSPLPPYDLKVGLSQDELIEGVGKLRLVLAEGAFRADILDFEASVLQSRVEYTCPMHPEVVQDEPGSCPKCGMTLMPKETAATTKYNHSEANKTNANIQVMQSHDMVHKTKQEYTCPMHPEVVQEESGSCPKCGMDLQLRQQTDENSTEKQPHHHQHMAHKTKQEYTCPMHPEVVQGEPGSCPKCGMDLKLRESTGDTPTEKQHEHHMSAQSRVEYTCPMHAEVVQVEPGSCPKCGMDLEQIHTVPQAKEHNSMTHSVMEQKNTSDANMDHSGMEHSSMDHSGMDHSGMSFMSMVDVTKDLPRSLDGLPMDWLDTYFGPFFPGLPAGLRLMLTLDGDTVAGCKAESVIEKDILRQQLPLKSRDFIQQLSALDPLSPVSFRLLACRALENLDGTVVSETTVLARIGALERERISSHLNWLALFAQQTGFLWLMRRASDLQLKFQQANFEQILALKPALAILIKRLQRTPLLKSRTQGIGQISTEMKLSGPVARAMGRSIDSRSTENTLTSMGFVPVMREAGDVFSRLMVRLNEMIQSFDLIEMAGIIGMPETGKDVNVSGVGEAEVETPRGLARLKLIRENGEVVSMQLQTPSTQHISLIEKLVEQQELGDALVAVGSLDLSPWEIQS